MTTTQLPPDGTPMSGKEFDALGEIRAEYVDGRIMTMPNPDRIHQDAVFALASALRAAVKPGFRVTWGWSWKPGRDEFIPDILVHTDTDEQVRYTGTPVLVVEVLGSRPVVDLWKASRYLAYDPERSWVLDPGRRELSVFGKQDGSWEHPATVGREPAEIDFGAGVALVDLAELVSDD